MNPYEATSQELLRQSEGPKRFLKGALSVGGAIGGLSFAPTLSRIAPLLSNYIPQELAIKGLNKIDPKLGQFANKALSSGFDFEEIKKFLGSQVEQSQKTEKESNNIIQKYSPELNEFILDRIKQGDTPLQAAARATVEPQKGKAFNEIIKKMKKDYKMNWGDIIESIFGPSEQAKPNENIQQKLQENVGPGQQALMSVLEKINQRLGQ